MRANVKAEYKKEWALIGETGWRANNVKKQWRLKVTDTPAAGRCHC